jgi:hypothetical protein
VKKDRKHKKYIPKHVAVPLTKAGHDTKALELHAYVETAIHRPSFGTCDELAKRLGAITAAFFALRGPFPNRKEPDAIAIQSMNLALEAVQKRFDEHGKWHINAQEAQSLRFAAGMLDGELRYLPYNVQQNAERLIQQLLTTMTAEQAAEWIAA